MNEILQEHFYFERWDKVHEMLSREKELIIQINAQDLAWKIFQYALAANGKDRLVPPFGEYVDLKKVISLCKKNGMTADSIPEAALLQDLSRIKQLLASGHKIDEHTLGERTGLLVSAAIDDLQLVEFFLDNNALVSFDDIENLEAIDYATDEKIIEFLKSKGGKTKEQRKEEYDAYCVATEQMNIVREINRYKRF